MFGPLCYVSQYAAGTGTLSAIWLLIESLTTFLLHTTDFHSPNKCKVCQVAPQLRFHQLGPINHFWLMHTGLVRTLCTTQSSSKSLKKPLIRSSFPMKTPWTAAHLAYDPSSHLPFIYGQALFHSTVQSPPKVGYLIQSRSSFVLHGYTNVWLPCSNLY